MEYEKKERCIVSPLCERPLDIAFWLNMLDYAIVDWHIVANQEGRGWYVIARLRVAEN